MRWRPIRHSTSTGIVVSGCSKPKSRSGNCRKLPNQHGYAPGSDPVPLVEAVRKALVTYTDKRRRVGLKAERLGIGGCGYVSGVEAVTLKSPTTDIGGGSKQAPNCTGINVVAVQAAGNWQ